MSGKNSPIPSNEDIVNEITKDLEDKLKTETNTKATNCENDDESLKEKFRDDTAHQDQQCEAKVKDDVHEDEEFKAEMDEKLTDEEKEERKDEALNLKAEGNEKYNNQQYEEAVKKYTQGLLICPSCFQKEKSIIYSNRAASHVKLEDQDAAIKDCSQAIELNPNYIKAILRRAQLYEKTDKLDECLVDYKRIVELDPNNTEAQRACFTLPERINERNEKMKTEMMGKLKDLGNLFLRPFGLSTNNFQMNQDPNTGGYSVNFQNNGNGKQS